MHWTVSKIFFNSGSPRTSPLIPWNHDSYVYHTQSCCIFSWNWDVHMHLISIQLWILDGWLHSQILHRKTNKWTAESNLLQNWISNGFQHSFLQRTWNKYGTWNPFGLYKCITDECWVSLEIHGRLEGDSSIHLTSGIGSQVELNICIYSKLDSYWKYVSWKLPFLIKLRRFTLCKASVLESVFDFQLQGRKIHSVF